MPDPLPWFPFYGADWWNSPRVLALEPADRDAYQFLLWLQWRDESLPAKPNGLWPLLAGNVKRSPAARMLEEFFPVCEDGRRRNGKMAELRAVAVKKLNTNRSRGKAGAKVRYGRTTTPTTPPTDSQTTSPTTSLTSSPTPEQAKSEHSESESESESETTSTSSSGGRYALPPQVEQAATPYLRSSRYPDAVRSSLMLLLDLEASPHFEPDLLARCLVEMQANNRPFNTGTLARWCQNKLTPLAATASSNGRNMGFLDALPDPPEETA